MQATAASLDRSRPTEAALIPAIPFDRIGKGQWKR